MDGTKVETISADFMDSQFCTQTEMSRALARHREGRALVIPILVRDYNWAETPFAEVQFLPYERCSITSLPDPDTAWADVARRIQQSIEGWLAQRGNQCRE